MLMEFNQSNYSVVASSVTQSSLWNLTTSGAHILLCLFFKFLQQNDKTTKWNLQEEFQSDFFSVIWCFLHFLLRFRPHKYSQGRIWLWPCSSNTWKKWKWNNLLIFSWNEIPFAQKGVECNTTVFTFILIGCNFVTCIALLPFSITLPTKTHVKI